jgi:DNA-binding transcriptional LysR family regulator
MGSGFLQRLLQTFWERHPNVTVELVDGTAPAEQIALVRGSRLDVAFVSDMLPPDDCDVIPLWKERLFVALPRSHRLKHRTALGWPALRDESIIIRKAKCDPELCERVLNWAERGSRPSSAPRTRTHASGHVRFIS